MLSVNNIKIKCYRWFNRQFFRLKGIRYGRNMQVYNKVYVTGRRGTITIGDDFHFTSGDCINPICRNLLGCIHTDSPSSVITIGDHVGMSSTCIWIHDRLTIGNHVSIGGGCIILDTDVHQLDYRSRRGEGVVGTDDIRTKIQSAPVVMPIAWC